MELTLPLLNSSQLQLAPDLCTFVQKAFLLLFIQKEPLSSRNLSEAYWNENDLGHIRYSCGFYYLLKILCTTVANSDRCYVKQKEGQKGNEIKE